MAEKGQGIDGGSAKAMANGSLLLEGISFYFMSTLPDKICSRVPFRIVMPPSRIKMELEYTPLNHIAKRIGPSVPKEQMATENKQAGFIARNSILSKAIPNTWS